MLLPPQILTTAGVGGLAPNVSFYLDEQPLAYPGRNLDVYAADVSRIEVLSGPQGTLFGASSQAGVVRLITNKPVIGESASSLEIERRTMSEGSVGDKFEYMTNIPLSDTSALRFVAYRDRRGGYIDQVAGTVDVTQSALLDLLELLDLMVCLLLQLEMVGELRMMLMPILQVLTMQQPMQ